MTIYVLIYDNIVEVYEYYTTAYAEFSLLEGQGYDVRLEECELNED